MGECDWRRDADPMPKVKKYLEIQEEYYGCDGEEAECIDAAAREPQGQRGDQQFQAIVEKLLSYLSRLF